MRKTAMMSATRARDVMMKLSSVWYCGTCVCDCGFLFWRTKRCSLYSIGYFRLVYFVILCVSARELFFLFSLTFVRNFFSSLLSAKEISLTLCPILCPLWWVGG